MRLLRWLGILVVLLAVGIAALFVGARFADGPIAIVPGGPLKSGELVADGNVDWSFAAEEAEIELQLASGNTSRTVWIVVHDKQAYIPCSLDFPPLKNWHKKALEDGRAIVRVKGKRYERTLAKIDDERLGEALGQIIARKYNVGEGSPVGDSTRAWFFRLERRL